MEPGALRKRAEVTWNFLSEYYLKATDGTSYVWSDGDYGGSDTMRSTDLTHDEWLEGHGVPYARWKGVWVIGDFIESRTDKPDRSTLTDVVTRD